MGPELFLMHYELLFLGMNLFGTAQERAEANAMNRALNVPQGMDKAPISQIKYSTFDQVERSSVFTLIVQHLISLTVNNPAKHIYHHNKT